eukprot:6897523-Heterocapsa_arctica.AAC.1
MVEQAASLQQKALVMNNKASTARLLATLKARPDILPSIMEHLDRMGVRSTPPAAADCPVTPSPARPNGSPLTGPAQPSVSPSL